MFSLSSLPLENLDLKSGLLTNESGAFNSFEGFVRNHNEGQKVNSLEYEAHESLCKKEAKKIFDEAVKQFSIINFKCIHRIGKLNIGEMAVWVGVTAAHRDDAFKACRYIIDQIKLRLPIWKKEFYANSNSGWINCDGCGLGARGSEEIKSSHQNIQSQNSEPRTQNPNKLQTLDPRPQNQYYSRQISLPEIGIKGQKKLTAAKVLVVGAGGLGCSALTTLAQSGVGTIGICDHDIIEESNLHRQMLYTFNDIGQKKVSLAKSQLTKFNPKVKIVEHPEKLVPENVLNSIVNYDIILDCTDNFKAKFILNDACYLKKKILIQASVHQWEGQLQILSPKSKGCLRCLWPQIPENNCLGSCVESGTIGVVPNIFGHLQGLETIKTILNLPTSLTKNLLIYNFLTLNQKLMSRPVNPQCPLCSNKKKITSINSNQYETSSALIINLKTLNRNRLKDFEFIDVRENDERLNRPAKNIKSLHLPMSQYPKSNFNFDKRKQYILFCAKGGRSLRLTKELHEQGVKNVLSLNNGIQAIEQYFSK